MSQTLVSSGERRKRYHLNERIECDLCGYSLEIIELFMYLFTCECCGKQPIDICRNCVTVCSTPELLERYSRITHKSIDLV